MGVARDSRVTLTSASSGRAWIGAPTGRPRASRPRSCNTPREAAPGRLRPPGWTGDITSFPPCPRARRFHPGSDPVTKTAIFDGYRDKLADARAKESRIADEMREIHVSAGVDGLSSGQQERWDRLERGRKNTEREIQTLEDEYRAVLADHARNPANTEAGDGTKGAPQFMRRIRPFDGTDPRSMGRDEARDKALAALEVRDLTEHLTDKQLEHLDRTFRAKTNSLDGSHVARMLLLSENEHYQSAFQEVITKAQPVLDADQARAVKAFNEFRAMSLTDAAGGFGVPVLIDPSVIMTAQGHPNDFFAIANVKLITTDEWKGVSSAGSTWSFDAEAAEVSDDSPTLAQPTVTTHKAQGFIPFSIEVGSDYPNFAAEMAALLSEGYSELVVEKLTTGSGSGEPKGVVTALDAVTTSEVTPTTDGAFGAVDLYKLWDNLPIRFRRKPTTAWMSSTDVMNEVRNFGTTLGSNFTVDLTDESIPRLFNRRYYENDYCADFTGTTGAANLLILGDWSAFVIAQRAGMAVELVPHLLGSNRRPSGQRGLYAWARIGSDVVATNAMRLLQNQ
jgi:HK97 family phage major capsid protein